MENAAENTNGIPKCTECGDCLCRVSSGFVCLNCYGKIIPFNHVKQRMHFPMDEEAINKGHRIIGRGPVTAGRQIERAQRALARWENKQRKEALG